MERKLAAAERDVATGGRGLARLNNDPQGAIEFTLSIHDAPGPFAVVIGSAQYDVLNEEQCGYIHPVGGTPMRVSSQEPLALTRISEHEYRGKVYLDLMQDEDYFERGRCRWELTGVGARLKATGLHEETRFHFFMERERLLRHDRQVTYYADFRYPTSGIDDFPEFGAGYPTDLKAETRKDLFSLSMQAGTGAQH